MKRWNGWGDDQNDLGMELNRSALAYLRQLIGPATALPDATLEQVLASVPPSRLPPQALVSLDPEDRLRRPPGPHGGAGQIRCLQHAADVGEGAVGMTADGRPSTAASRPGIGFETRGRRPGDWDLGTGTWGFDFRARARGRGTSPQRPREHRGRILRGWSQILYDFV